MGRALPSVSSKQSWAHSVCSRSVLARALEDGGISAIETDLVWSERTNAVVHAHPPATDSDLPFDAFLDEVTRFARRRP